MLVLLMSLRLRLARHWILRLWLLGLRYALLKRLHLFKEVALTVGTPHGAHVIEINHFPEFFVARVTVVGSESPTNVVIHRFHFISLLDKPLVDDI